MIRFAPATPEFEFPIYDPAPAPVFPIIGLLLSAALFPEVRLPLPA